MKTRRRALLSVLLAPLLLVATGCGGSDKASSASGSKTITISNFAFAPETLQAKVGDTITVENKDSTDHTVTATDKSFDTGAFSGKTTFTVTKAGRIEYMCEIHPFMPHRFIQVAG